MPRNQSRITSPLLSSGPATGTGRIGGFPPLAPETAELSPDSPSLLASDLLARFLRLPVEQQDEVSFAVGDAEERAAGRRDGRRYDVLTFVEGSIAAGDEDEHIGYDLSIDADAIAEYRSAVERLLASVQAHAGLGDGEG